VAKKRDPREIPEIDAVMNKIHAKLGERGRLLVRPSGTENLIRIMVEGEDARDIRACAEEIAECVRKRMAG